MASGTMMSKTGALSSVGRTNRTAFTSSRMVAARRHTVAVKAAQQPNDIAMGVGKALGALAAVQLALLPATGPAMADLLPKTATSQSARDALNAKTSALPSLKKTAENAGDALSGDVDLQANVQKAGQGLKEATGNDLGSQAKGNAKGLFNKAKTEAKSAIGGDIGSQAKSNAKGLFNKAKSATGGDLGSQAKGAFKKATGNDLGSQAKGALDKVTGNDIGSEVKSQAKGLFNKAKGEAGSFPNPAREFANRAKGAASRATAAVTDNPAKEFANRSKAAVQENLPVDGPAEWDLSSLQVNVSEKLQAQASNTAKQASTKAKRVVEGIPDPSQFAAKAKQAVDKATGSLPSNPAADFAAKAKQTGNKISNGNISNPARDFANAAKKAKAQVSNNSLRLPVSAAPALYDYSALQKDVGFFGFGKKAVNKAQDAAQDVKSNASSAADAAGSVADKASSVADKASDAASTVAENVPEPKASFNIFNAGSVDEARKTLKANIENTANEKKDPAERVFPIGKPGETQEENAERIRQQSENGAVAGGDARAPTN